uniref:Uncharacterized protein n=1 Tax=Trypanosoma congolense (strain IL3000) TaxID=1068625 RepID=G0ULG3_TRYCI|nr:conserved hypothetical protein [Trypanosoma congolense IL3000]
MGQDQSVALATDTIQGEQYRGFQLSQQNIVHRAFQKCVAPSSDISGGKGGMELDNEERACVEEFAFLYSAYAKNSFAQFSQLYEQNLRDMYEMARMEAAARQARKDLKH